MFITSIDVGYEYLKVVEIVTQSYCFIVVLGGLIVIVLAIGPRVREFKPGCERLIFKGDKNPQHDFRWRVNKAVCRMS
jgi:hypothetical protein